MISEKEFKKKLIDKLNKIDISWFDGDLESGQNKKADIVNHRLEIAIEIKDDKKHKTEISGAGSTDLSLMNKRLQDDIRDANKKFEQYPSYKTILLFRTDFYFSDIMKYAMRGPKVLHINKNTQIVENVSRETKYSPYIFKNIGCFLVFNQNAFYFSNNYALSERVLNKEKIEKLFEMNFAVINDI